jgi:hypothetical protein
MLRKAWIWLRSRVALSRMAKAERTVAMWQARGERLAQKIEGRLRRLRALEKRLAVLCKSVVEDGEEAAVIQERSTQAMEALRAERDILALTIKGMTRSHQLLLERMEADIAVNVRRRVAYTPGQQGSEGYAG